MNRKLLDEIAEAPYVEAKERPTGASSIAVSLLLWIFRR